MAGILVTCLRLKRTHEKAVRIAEKHGYRIYDSLIIASAVEAKCGMLYSEDLQNGQVIDERMTIGIRLGNRTCSVAD